ncbi:MAG: hypothetical protein EA406_02190 [Rhodospirillales bacterium]|nr:MAG: hypothetical protein EA406_02190 [Rhodospirillales bacterium]
MSRFVQQTNWSRGEIEPRLLGRQDAEFYDSAAELLDNWLPDTVSSISVRASFQSLLKIPLTIVGPEDQTLLLRRSFQNLLGYVFRGVQVVVHLALYFDEDTEESYLAIRAYRIALERLDTDSPRVLAADIAGGGFYLSPPIVDPDPAILYEVGFSVAGPAAFLTHRLFPPVRVFPDSLDPTAASFNVSTPVFYRELFGFVTPQAGTNDWEGSEEAIFDEQLEVGDTIKFRNQLYTVASITVSTDEETEGQQSFTTVETYTGETLTDRVDVLDPDPFGGNPSLVAFYQGRLVLAATDEQPTGVWLSRSGDPFTIVPSSVDDGSPINQELFAEGADEFVWMTGGDRLYLGSGLGEYALGSPDETLTPTQLRFFRIGQNGGARVTPVVVDGTVIFANRSRSQVLGVVYDLARQSFSTNNLSILSGHLTQGVLDLTYRPPVENDRTPRIFALTPDGLRAFALSEAAGVAAWNRISHSPAFTIKAVAGTSEYLFAICNRNSGYVDLAVLRNE